MSNNPEIISTVPLFQSRWINLFERTVKTGDKIHKWQFASRQAEPDLAKDKKPDAVIIVAATKDKKLVLTREYRAPLGDWILGLPAGLIEEGQTPKDAAIREMKEETGLKLHVTYVSPNLFSSAGFGNESFRYVFGVAEGEISSEFLQGDENIEVILADIDEAYELMKTSHVCGRLWPLYYFQSIGLA